MKEDEQDQSQAKTMDKSTTDSRNERERKGERVCERGERGVRISLASATEISNDKRSIMSMNMIVCAC